MAIVALSVVAGAKLLGAADDTVQVWTAAGPVAAGERVDASSFVATRVRFADEEALRGYLPVGEALPADATMTRSLGAGELVPRSALGQAADIDGVRVPLTLPATAVLPDLRPGQRVDVYVASQETTAGAAELVLEDAEVVAVSSASEGLAATGERQVVLGLAEDQRRVLGDALGMIAHGTVTVVGRS